MKNQITTNFFIFSLVILGNIKKKLVKKIFEISIELESFIKNRLVLATFRINFVILKLSFSV